MLSTRLSRHPLEECCFAQSQSVDVVTFCTGQYPCQGSTLEKLVLWKPKIGGSLTPFSSSLLSAQMYFFHAYAQIPFQGVGATPKSVF